uniref:Uncharacterized protein n=1 Tax=Romanomermis culicivorax TaxID=13658 RepID=A0A915JJU2_ROMCU
MNGDFFTEKNEPDTTSPVIDHQQREASRLIVEGPEKKPESSTISPKLDKVPEESKFTAEEDRQSDIRDGDKMDQNANKVLQQDQQHLEFFHYLFFFVFPKRVQKIITTPDEGIDIDHFVSQPVLVGSRVTNGNFNSFASSTDNHHHGPVSYEDIDFLSKSPKTEDNVPNFVQSENFGDQRKEQYQLEEELFVEEPPIRLNSSSSVDIIKDDESEDLESRRNFNLENSCNIINGVFENSIIIDRNSQSSSDLPPPPAIMDGLTLICEKTESPDLERPNSVTDFPVLVTNFPNTVIDGIFDNRPLLSSYGQDIGEPPEDLLSPSDDANGNCLLDLVDGEEIYTCRIMTPETDRDSEGDVLSKPESPIPILEPQSPVPIFKPESSVHVLQLGSSIAAPISENPAPIPMSECPVHVPSPESPSLKLESTISNLESPAPESESSIPKPKSPSPIPQQQHEIMVPKVENPVPSAPLLSNQVIDRDDTKNVA